MLKLTPDELLFLGIDSRIMPQIQQAADHAAQHAAEWILDLLRARDKQFTDNPRIGHPAYLEYEEGQIDMLGSLITEIEVELKGA